MIKIFEIYRPRSTDSNELEPYVSLSKNSIVLNKFARKLLNEPLKLEIAFDRENNILRIKPSDTGLKLSKTKVLARNLFHYFRIDKKGKFKCTYNEEDKALFVDLNQVPV